MTPLMIRPVGPARIHVRAPSTVTLSLRGRLPRRENYCFEVISAICFDRNDRHLSVKSASPHGVAVQYIYCTDPVQEAVSPILTLVGAHTSFETQTT